MNINRLVPILTLAFVVSCLTPARAQSNLESDPAYLAIDKAFDFKTLKPEVNINLPKFLLKDALADWDGGKNDPLEGTGIKLSELIQDIKLIRVVVLKGDKANGDAITRGIANLRSTLEAKWNPIVVVSEENEKVGIYAISDPSGEAVAGLAVVIHEKGGEAVIANIVGRVSIGKIIKVAPRMNKLPKDLLKKLGHAAESDSAAKPKDSPEKKDNPEKPAN